MLRCHLPSGTTLSTGTLRFKAMYPSTEKTTKPARKLVAQLIEDVIRASLCEKHTGRISGIGVLISVVQTVS